MRNVACREVHLMSWISKYARDGDVHGSNGSFFPKIVPALVVWEISMSALILIICYIDTDIDILARNIISHVFMAYLA